MNSQLQTHAAVERVETESMQSEQQRVHIVQINPLAGWLRGAEVEQQLKREQERTREMAEADRARYAAD